MLKQIGKQKSLKTIYFHLHFSLYYKFLYIYLIIYGTPLEIKYLISTARLVVLQLVLQTTLKSTIYQKLLDTSTDAS